MRHGRGHGGERRVDDDLADRLGAKRTRRLVARLKGHANAADIQARGQLVAHEVAGAQTAALIVLDDLVERMADTLGNAALGLDARERLVDNGAAVHSRHVVHHGHLAGGLVDLDLGNAGHKRRRRNGQAGRGMRGERVAARNVLDAQVGEVAQREVAIQLARGALVGQAHVLAIEDHIGDVHIPHLGGLDANLLAQLGRGVLSGKARHVRTRARVRAGVERRHVGVHAAHHDHRTLHAQLLGGNLRQDRVDAHAVIGGAGADGNEAVLFQAHVDAGDVHVGDTRALHGERTAQGAHAVAQVHG